MKMKLPCPRQKRSGTNLRMLVAAVCLCCGCAKLADSGKHKAAVLGQIPPAPASQDEKMKWFREAKFGLFIHWGLYAVPAGNGRASRSPASASGS